MGRFLVVRGWRKVFSVLWMYFGKVVTAKGAMPVAGAFAFDVVGNKPGFEYFLRFLMLTPGHCLHVFSVLTVTLTLDLVLIIDLEPGLMSCVEVTVTLAEKVDVAFRPVFHHVRISAPLFAPKTTDQSTVRGRCGLT